MVISSVSSLELYTTLNMKFATKFLSRQGRSVHPEHVTSQSENNAKLRDARHHLQVALQRVTRIEAMISQQRALNEKDKKSRYSVDLSVLENQRNEYVTYVSQKTTQVRHLEVAIRRHEIAAKLTSTPEVLFQCTG